MQLREGGFFEECDAAKPRKNVIAANTGIECTKEGTR